MKEGGTDLHKTIREINLVYKGLKCYFHPVGGSFLAGKAAWALGWCLTTESADFLHDHNEWAWLRSRVCLLRLEVGLGSVLESELREK